MLNLEQYVGQQANASGQILEILDIGLTPDEQAVGFNARNIDTDGTGYTEVSVEQWDDFAAKYIKPRWAVWKSIDGWAST